MIKTLSYLLTAAFLFVWAFVNLVTNTMVFKEADVMQERIWISGVMLFTGIVPLCIAIWLVLASGLFPAAPVKAEIADEQQSETGARDRDRESRRNRKKRRNR